MLRRPNPTDSEEDLLLQQQRFLSSGTLSGVNVVRRPDKRRGEGGGDLEVDDVSQKDVVTIEDLPEELPTLTPAAPKKSRFKRERVHFEDEDPEERLDRHDTHVSAVLSRIIERDTSLSLVSVPTITGIAFPKVMHRSETESQVLSSGGKKSIFARQIAAQRQTTGDTPHAPSASGQTPSDSRMETSETSLMCERLSAVSKPKLVSGLGLGGPGSTADTLKINQENEAKLKAMSQEEIIQEQKRLLAQLDPKLIDFVRSRKSQSNLPSAPCLTNQGDRGVERHLQESLNTESEPKSSGLQPESLEVDMEKEEYEGGGPGPQPFMKESELPVRPQKEWLHMDKLEPEKLEWTRDLPAPKRKGTKETMQARFDFAGVLIPPTKDLPTHLGLHHHGEEPELAGYSLQELFLLARSQLIPQRTLALNTLANILAKACAGSYASTLKGSVTSTLLDAGLVFLLRFSLDDNVEGVMSAAVHALRSLLVSSEYEECMDSTFSWWRGMASFPLLPFAQEEEDEEDEKLEESLRETAKEKEEKKTDHDVVTEDVIKGLLRMKLLPRLRYILEVVRPSPPVVQDMLEVLTRVARHSPSSALQVLDCSRLMETVMTEFLPTSWSLTCLPIPRSVYGLPLASAMKLLRVLASSGRHACARLLNSLGVKERLSRLLSPDPSELLLEPAEAFRITTEAYRFWAVSASYGQACSIYIDLYLVLVQIIQSAQKGFLPSDPLLPLQLHRVQALLSLLTQVTHTAGVQQEIQTNMANSQGSECLPPPAMSWSHVTGLQALLLGQLKGCVRGLDDPNSRDSSLSLMPAYLLYMEAYYHQLTLQDSFKPVETLQDLELLTSEVLLPLLSHNAVQSLIKNLTFCSIVCNPQGYPSSPDITPSLPIMACPGRRECLGFTASTSPFPVLTALGHLLDTIIGIHKGLSCKFASLLLSGPVLGYMSTCVKTTPGLSQASFYLLRHEHHLLYLLLRLAHRLVPVDSAVAQHASLYHQVALVLLPWLLPGSEYLAHELLSTIVFSKDFIREGHCGGPEAIELAELKLHDENNQFSPSPATHALGPLLREACVHLPSIRGCFLTHLAHLEPSVLVSRDAYLCRAPWINSQILPEITGPSLPSDWSYLPLVSLYESVGVSDGGGLQVEDLPQGALQAVTHCLQWLLMLEVWREDALKVVLPVAKLARLSCVFLCSSDLFLERPIQRLAWALLRMLTRPSKLDSLDLNIPPPGLASFQGLYSALVAQYEAVSFGDRLFGCWVLLPLQRRFSAAMRLAVFGEHVGMLRSLGVTLEQLSIPIEKFTSPPEDSLPLLGLYFRSLVMGTLRQSWCPFLYVVTLCHVNAFIFSQNAASQQVVAARRSMLKKTYHLTNEVLRSHLLLFRLPQRHSELGFDTYEQLPPVRARCLESVLGMQGDRDRKRD